MMDDPQEYELIKVGYVPTHLMPILDLGLDPIYRFQVKLLFLDPWNLKLYQLLWGALPATSNTTSIHHRSNPCQLLLR